MSKKPSVSILLFVASSLAFLGGCSNNSPDDSAHSGPIMNYHRIDDRLLTGGHLLDDGPSTLAAEGINVVIDLRDESPAGEKHRYAEHGIKWSNIPIEWSNPKAADFDHFRDLMREHQDDHVLVQCAANYRASAMTYLYRVIVNEVPESEARKDMNAVWNPDEYEAWGPYIGEILSANGH